MTLEIQFETVLERDAFLLAARIMRLRRNIPMSSILSNVDNLILNYWFPCDEKKRENFSKEYQQLSYELHSYKSITQKMIKIYNSQVHENENLSQNIDVLEHDLEFSVKELSLLVKQLRESKLNSEKELSPSLHHRIDNAGKIIQGYGVDIDKVEARSQVKVETEYMR